MIKAILLDDEPNALKSLAWELESFKERIEVLEKFTSTEEALDYIKKNNFDCLFLDIQMPEMDGFQFLSHFQKRDFAVVFTTAYSEYGIDAIKNEALDYLTKPVDYDDLKSCIDKIERHRKNKLTLDVLEEKLINQSDKKIKISVDGKLLFLDADEVMYCESDGNYTKIFLQGNNRLFVTKKLKEVHELLPKTCFFRVHNSYVVNLRKIREYLKTDAYVVLADNTKIPVSRNKKSKFLDQM